MFFDRLPMFFDRMAAIELSVAVDFVEEINLDETLISRLGLVIIDNQLSELLRVSKAILALSGVFNKFIGQNLYDFNSPV